jgi:hypothetical protein
MNLRAPSFGLALAASFAAASLRAQEIPAWMLTIDQSATGSGDTAWTLVRDPSSGRLYVGGWYQTSAAPDAFQGFVAACDASGALL